MTNRLRTEPLVQGHLDDNSATYEHCGMTLNLREWSRSRMCKCSLRALRQRMTKGWTFSTALRTPTCTALNRVAKPGKPGPKAKPEWKKRKEEADKREYEIFAELVKTKVKFAKDYR